MKPIREVAPECDRKGYFSPACGYETLVESDGGKIVVEVSSDDYQGDSRCLIHDTVNDRYGLLTFGWGSCSGCDALEACDSYEDLDELRNDLVRSIEWFPNGYMVVEHLRNHDWEGDYDYRSDERKEFHSKIYQYFGVPENLT